MIINIVGTSKVAFAITKALVEKGYKVEYVVSRQRDKAKAYVQTLGQGKPVEYEDNFELSGITFVAVPDDVLEKVYERIRKKVIGGTLIHFSGFLGSEVFYDADSRDFGRASLHPNLSFADFKTAELHIRKCCFGIEGNDKGLKAAEEIAKSVSNCFVKIPPNVKPAYHLAAVIASNFLVGLAYLAKMLYEKYEIPNFDKIIPALMENTVHNISTLGVRKALTGPVARGDWKVVQAEKEIFINSFPDFAQFYDTMVRILSELKRGDFV
ncbi:Rossmann-like and DUF2520 domain-containing protein [Pseudothermotoga thermarum]|uniref:DUF2520 domain-containing protein n=1 Tax=Pseudothermotoga thermarum DSM 5069 TaxID=688269 RepID=F7YX55_9THEM|nr:DUF2520 domain-containing protein [Pseudothermotoga thermarum]AEH50893.1 Domain of unknown function DUF2520 [Pseudothermotoga thermarum DSM 5069]